MLIRRNLLLACSAAVVLSLLAGTVNAEKKMPLIKTRLFDPSAPQFQLFDAMDDETVSVKVVAMNAHEGALFVTNNTEGPVTIQLPEAFVGVQVLAQFGNNGGNGNGGGFGNQQGGQNGQQGGQNQQFGGGQGGQQGGFGQQGNQQGGQQQGFFSIPAERTVRVPYISVCLDHGRPDPNPRITYKIIRVEEYSKDKNVQELIKMIGSGSIDKSVAQAAAWHLTSGMSWDELASKMYNNLGRPDTPYFQSGTIAAAQQFVSVAEQRAQERADEPAPETTGTKTFAEPSATTP